MLEQLTPIHMIFYLFAFIAAASAVFVITARNPVRSVLSLVVTFFSMAGVWMILHAEFLSLILILVYVGAVMTLFLFVVMMLNIDREQKRSGYVRYLPFGLLIVALLIALMLTTVGSRYFGIERMPAPAPAPVDYSNISQLGALLYTQYVFPFEVAGVILLAAIIASISLTYRGPLRRKVQNPSMQVKANAKQRLRLIDIPSAPKPSRGES